MNCLIKVYDEEQINNLVSILSFKPKKTVFLYDSRISTENLSYLETACYENIDNINFEFVAINIESLDDIKQKCKKVMRENKDCIFDITGAEELGAIGAYLSSVSRFIPIFKIDLHGKKLVNIYGCSLLSKNFHMPDLDIKTMLMSRGAVIEKSIHPSPNPSQFGQIIEFSKIVFENPVCWKNLCSYIQNGVKQQSTSGNLSMSFFYKRDNSDIKTSLPEECEKLLFEAERFKILENVKITCSEISFDFVSPSVKKYMTDFGSWLELYTYINLLDENIFKDVKMSVKVGWGGMDDSKIKPYLVNEIDVAFFDGISPVFISCKLSIPTSEALQELVMYASYFGGELSKCILVTASNLKNDKTKILKRAEEMGISIVDYNDIKSGNFVNCIKKCLSKARSRNW